MSDVKSIVQINESEVKNHLSEMVRGYEKNWCLSK
jgi:hypothetical protein